MTASPNEEGAAQWHSPKLLVITPDGISIAMMAALCCTMRQTRFLTTGRISDPEEFQVIVGMLRNETPLWFDDAKHLRTVFGASGEPTG
jgi:hypothetical protein